MDRFTSKDLQELLRPCDGPCVSVFTATHRGGADLQDFLRWKEQLNEAEQLLVDQGVEAGTANRFMDRARSFLKSEGFWKNLGDGLALLMTEDTLNTYRLPLSFVNQVVVGPTRHVKPLLPWLSDDGRFYVLAVSQNHVRVLEGTAHDIRRLELANLPANIDEALGAHDVDEVLTYHTHPAAIGRAFQAVFSGHGVGIDDHKADLLRYFQKIDRALHKMFGTGNAPLVLATVDYLLPIYAKANKYAHLADQNIKGNPDYLSDQELHDRAWPLVAPHYRGRAVKAIAQYRQLAGTGRTVRQLAEILPAVQRGELETLVVVGQRDVWGTFNPVTGDVEEHGAYEPGDEELTNLAITCALRRERNVYLVDPHDEFGDVPLAGVFFVPMAKHAR